MSAEGVAQQPVGHSSVAFTMDICSHIIEGMQADDTAQPGEVLPPTALLPNSRRFAAKSRHEVASDLKLCFDASVAQG